MSGTPKKGYIFFFLPRLYYSAGLIHLTSYILHLTLTPMPFSVSVVTLPLLLLLLLSIHGVQSSTPITKYLFNNYCTPCWSNSSECEDACKLGEPWSSKIVEFNYFNSGEATGCEQTNQYLYDYRGSDCIWTSQHISLTSVFGFIKKIGNVYQTTSQSGDSDTLGPFAYFSVGYYAAEKGIMEYSDKVEAYLRTCNTTEVVVGASASASGSELDTNDNGLNENCSQWTRTSYVRDDLHVDVDNPDEWSSYRWITSLSTRLNTDINSIGGQIVLARDGDTTIQIKMLLSSNVDYKERWKVDNVFIYGWRTSLSALKWEWNKLNGNATKLAQHKAVLERTSTKLENENIVLEENNALLKANSSTWEQEKEQWMSNVSETMKTNVALLQETNAKWEIEKQQWMSNVSKTMKTNVALRLDLSTVQENNTVLAAEKIKLEKKRSGEKEENEKGQDNDSDSDSNMDEDGNQNCQGRLPDLILYVAAASGWLTLFICCFVCKAKWCCGNKKKAQHSTKEQELSTIAISMVENPMERTSSGV